MRDHVENDSCLKLQTSWLIRHRIVVVARPVTLGISLVGLRLGLIVGISKGELDVKP